jgi:hypothetical protein
VNGTAPEIEAGAPADAITPFPLKAAFGALPPPPPGPVAVIPDLTGKLEAAATWTVPPTTFATPG